MGDYHTPAAQSAINALPRIKISEKEAKESCSICNEDFKLQTEATEMPCEHMFHSACLLTWLKQTNTCPVCHYQIPSQAPSSSGSSTTPPIPDWHGNVILRPQLPYDMDPDLAPPPVTLPTSYGREIDDFNYLCDIFGYGSHRPE